MDHFAAEIATSRVLLALARSKVSGLLTAVAAGGVRGEVRLQDGDVVAAKVWPHQDDALGDLLLASDAFALDRHASALRADHGPQTGAVGAWLEAHGVADAMAVRAALARQAKGRLLRLVEAGAVMHFTPGSTQGPIEPVWSVGIVEAVTEAFVRILKAVSLDALCRHLGQGKLRWVHGQDMTLPEVLRPAEAALVAGADAHTVLGLLAYRGDAARALVGASLCGLIIESTRGQRRHNRSYLALLRKQREVRARRSAETLLEVPMGADRTRARRNLKQLAKRLHPDVFGTDAHPAVRRASEQVMAALTQSCEQIR